MLQSSLKFVCRTVSAGACASLAILALTPAHAAQVVDPIHVSGGNRTAGDNLSTGSITLPAGTAMTFDVRYSVSGSQTANEAGLGLKLRYDANRFDNVNVTAINAAGGNFTDVTNMLTKCVVAAPSDQVGSYSSPSFTTPREVVFGWLDTSLRAGGAVGWPGTADPASPNGCLNPGFATATGAVTLPATLFRVTLKAKPGFTSGTTTVRLTADGNVSYANASPGMADKDITVNGAPAPACSLDADGSGTNQALVDGILIIRNMLSFMGGPFTSGITFPGSATRTTEAAIKGFLATQNYDLDGDGTQQALVDGILLIRLMLGVSDPMLLEGITLGTGATRTTAAAIRNYVNTTCGTSY